MTWPEQWRSLAARIDGLLRAAEFLTDTFAVHSRDESAVINKSLKPALSEIITSLNSLTSTYAKELPPKALEAVLKFVALRTNEGITNDAIHIQKFAHLASFRSEFEYLLRDYEVEKRNLTELAFEHLRRQLAVDDDIRKKWQEAFHSHETKCERLGAVHLLSHGIWAFKVSAPGSATDLVFGHPVERDEKLIRRTARALVLTEWKLFKNAEDMSAKAQEAQEQTKIYSGGILGDSELKQTRYLILVGKFDLEAPADQVINGITFRHIILPMESELPSKAARRAKQPKKSQGII